MKREEIETSIKEILINLSVDKNLIKNNVNLRKEGVLDSMSEIVYFIQIEEKYLIKMDNDIVEKNKIDTISDMINYIYKLKNN
ncbi:MAG: hypothetical protein STSR0008_13980 [Ignavibacterium sp.]